MAAKSQMAFNAEQTEALSTAVKALVNNMTTQFDEIDNVFRQFEGEEIIGESTQKEPVVQAISIARDAFKSVTEKLSRINATIDSVCSELGIAINQNIKSNEEAVTVIATAAGKAKEATGANG